MSENAAIVLKIEPVIEYSKLEAISKEVNKRIEELHLETLSATEENIKTLKETRSALNKEKTAFETDRKNIKKAVLAPYDLFETKYKELILSSYDNAETLLKTKIDGVENELKRIKEEEIKAYFEEHRVAHNIDFISYEQANINVTLSASTKSLKDQVLKFVEQVVSDLEVIETHENKVRILAQYKKTLNLSGSIIQVAHDIEDEECVKEAYLNQAPKAPVAETPTVEKVEEIIEVQFTVKGTTTQLRALKQYMIDNKIKFE